MDVTLGSADIIIEKEIETLKHEAASLTQSISQFATNILVTTNIRSRL